MKHWLILSVYFICIILNFSAAQESETAVDELIKKICTLARDKLQIQKYDRGERLAILESMKEKLKKSSEALGLQSTAHIRLIIQGVTILTLDENYNKLCEPKMAPPERRAAYLKMRSAAKSKARTNIAPDNSTTNNVSNLNVISNTSNLNTTSKPQNYSKIEHIKSLVTKMEAILRKSVKKQITPEKKLKTAERLKLQFLSAFRKTYNNSKKLDTYIDLARQGMNIAIQKLFNNSRKMEANNHDFMVGAKPRLGDSITSPTVETTPWPYTTESNQLQGVTKQYICNNVLKDTCKALKELEKFRCEYDNSLLALQQMCDGNIDCPDGSDEKYCIKQVINKIHNATEVMATVESSHFCFKSIVDNTMLSKQGQLLSSLLNTQVDFLKKHKQNDAFQQQNINEIAFEVAVIVRSFATTLVEALCKSEISTSIDIINIGSIAALEKEIDEMEFESRNRWMPSTCKCTLQYCEDITCVTKCKRFCYQKYSLENFNCKSLQGETIIPLELVCDGKIDCLDETDELDCPRTGDIGRTKVEASKLYDKAINDVKSGSLKQSLAPVRIDLIELQICIQNLQKRSMVFEFDLEQIKFSRDKCFKELKEIYEVMCEEGQLINWDQEMFYNFLLTVNNDLVSALKYTHNGNAITPSSDDCVCRGSQCAQLQCSEYCMLLCPLKMTLTNYNCDSILANVSVPIENICDGKINCPGAEDEMHCKQEICRIHHLKVIYKEIENICAKYHGTRIGEVLDKWKTKVTLEISYKETQERITYKEIKMAINQWMLDLAKIVTSMETHRSLGSETRFKKFGKIAQYIMEQIKNCY